MSNSAIYCGSRQFNGSHWRFAYSVALAAWVLTFGTRANAANLINFNFTSTAFTDTTETSPATPTGTAGTWNNLLNGTLNDPASWENDGVAVLMSDGSAGPTLTLDMSSGTSSNNAWNGTSLTAQTAAYTTGVYNVANLYQTGISNGGNATTGFRIKGLAPGNYEISVVPMFRSPQAAGQKQDVAVHFKIGLGNDTDARNGGDYTLTTTSKDVTQFIDTTLTAWTAATDGSIAYNYIGATITIDSANRWLTILMGDSALAATPDRAGFSTIQIKMAGAPAGGDFDGDGDADGNDFLKWQRGESPNPNSATDLAAWRAAFGSNSLGAASSIPEPTTGSLIAAALTLAALRRRQTTRMPAL